MNNKTLLTMLLCLAAHTASAQDMGIDKKTIDCGRTGFMIPVTAKFEIRNKATRPLTITKVRTDCGCTQAELPKGSLAPGEKFTLKLTYDAHILGHYIKQAAIYTDDSDTPTFIKMQGVVVAEAEDYSGNYPYNMGGLLTDIDHIEFTDVNKGERPQVVINIMNNTGGRVQPNIQHLPDYLTAEVKPETLESGRHGKLTLTLNSEGIHDYGLTQTSVYLAGKLGDKINADSELPVSVLLLPDMSKFKGTAKHTAPQMQLSANVINLGLIDGKQKKAETIIIQNVGKSLLKISSIQMFTSGVKLILGKRELKPGESTKLKVMADCDELLKARQTPRILMITNDPEQAKVTIDINVK